MLVSLLDGKLVALNRESGQQLWTLHTGPSLVSTWTAPMGGHAEQCASDLQHAAGTTCSDDAPGIQVFPGLDGTLFMAHTSDGSLENVQVCTLIDQACHRDHQPQRLPLSVQQLVQQSPSLTQSDGLLLGRRTTTVFVVDADSGAIVKAFWDHEADATAWLEAQAAADAPLGQSAMIVHQICAWLYIESVDASMTVPIE